MKDKPSEWIAISDLMAGVMAVVMLLLVVSVLQKGISELRYKEELVRLNSTKNDSISKVTSALQAMLGKKSGNDLIVLDLPARRLTLRDGVFERGSACLTSEARAAVANVQGHLANFLLENPSARILVEGYTDNAPVKSPVTDYQRFCTVYDDNFTLSAARAREARRALIGTLDTATAQRIVVAGYGDSRPLPGVNPADARNRRVEVQLAID
ncbi:flagellar motor protein MotB [Niveibacterium sp.]|uniref:OmpA/MotB family protein n=1 Tax=Niveibacterium sp. TaxID=2017444 RepID=UPI0035B4C333